VGQTIILALHELEKFLIADYPDCTDRELDRGRLFALPIRVIRVIRGKNSLRFRASLE